MSLITGCKDPCPACVAGNHDACDPCRLGPSYGTRVICDCNCRDLKFFEACTTRIAEKLSAEISKFLLALFIEMKKELSK